MRSSFLPGTDVPTPTAAELEILQVVWEQKLGTVGSLHYDLNQRRKRGYTTVLKMLQIMLSKGLVRRTEKDRVHFYAAMVTQAEVRSAFVSDIADRLFDGSLVDLVSCALTLMPLDDAISAVRTLRGALGAASDDAQPQSD